MNKTIYVFGNGNLSFENFKFYYEKEVIEVLKEQNVSFVICDFKGVDTLTMELLKSSSSNVTVMHIGDKPRYMPYKY